MFLEENLNNFVCPVKWLNSKDSLEFNAKLKPKTDPKSVSLSRDLGKD